MYRDENKHFSVVLENADLHFIIHQESFLQKQKGDWQRMQHSHAYYEVLYASGDTCQLQLNGRNIPLDSHSFAVIRPRQMHCAFFDNPKDLQSIGFFYKKASAPANRRAKMQNTQQNNLFGAMEQIFSADDYVSVPSGFLAELFTQLQGLDSYPDLITEGLTISVLLQILYHIMLLLEGKPHPAESSNQREHFTPPHPSAADNLYHIDAILSTRYMEDITPERLSREYLVSARQINRYIYSLYGETFLQRRTALRIEVAKRLLKSTELPIAEIAATVGYRSINTFFSAFETRCRMTPKQFRDTTP